MQVDHRILVVDNNNDRRQQLRTLLETRNYGVIEAANCEDAIELLSQMDVSLVLTETELPTMSGLFLLQKVKQLHPNLEVILITNNDSSFNLLQALRLGAYDYIVRPIDTGEILDKTLERVFTHVALRNQNQMLLGELEQQNHNLQHSLVLIKQLNSSIEKVSSATDVKELFKTLLASTLKTINAKRGFIALVDHHSEKLRLKAGSGIAPAQCRRYARELPHGLTAHLLKNGKPVLVPEKMPATYHSLSSETELRDLYEFPGLLAAPLHFMKKEVGIIVISGNNNGGKFSEYEMHFLIQLAHHACIALEKTGEIHLLKKDLQQHHAGT
jgi:DNA-binding response OmpR family regulator